jgi:hypothetical protein
MLRGELLPTGGSIAQTLKRRRDYKKNPTEVNAKAMLDFPVVRLPTLRSATRHVQTLLESHYDAIIRHRDSHEGLMQAFAAVAVRELAPLFPQAGHEHMQRVIRATLHGRSAKQHRRSPKPSYSLEWLRDHLRDRSEAWCTA